MKNKITKSICSLIILFGGFFNGTWAQSSQDATALSFAPQKGEMMFSLRFGKAIDYADLKYSEISQYNQSVTIIEQPYAATDRYTDMNTKNNGNLKVNSVGLEFKYFFTPQIAAKVNGSGIISSSPSQDYIEGMYNGSQSYTPASHYSTDDPSGYPNDDIIDDIEMESDNSRPFTPGIDLSTYEDIEGETRMQFNVDLGVDYYFKTKVERINPYAGMEFNYLYARAEYSTGYEGFDELGNVILSAGPRLGEVYGFGGSALAGIDYYITQGLFLGVEVKAFSYMYNAKRIFFQEGTEAYDACTHNTMICDQLTFKLGFKF